MIMSLPKPAPVHFEVHEVMGISLFGSCGRPSFALHLLRDQSSICAKVDDLRSSCGELAGRAKLFWFLFSTRQTASSIAKNRLESSDHLFPAEDTQKFTLPKKRF